MTFVFGVLGALMTISGVAFSFVMVILETADRRAGRMQTPVEQAWVNAKRQHIRVCFWVGALLMLSSAIIATSS
jgi:hypothetical protein